MAVFDQNLAGEKSSGNIGYEIINDRRGGRKQSNRRSTPDSGRYLRSQETTSRERHQLRHEDDILLTPIHPIVQRVVKKRTKQNLVRKIFLKCIIFCFNNKRNNVIFRCPNLMQVKMTHK